MLYKYVKLFYSFSIASTLLGVLGYFYWYLIVLLVAILYFILDRIIPDAEEKTNLSSISIIFFSCFIIFALKYRWSQPQDTIALYLPISKYIAENHTIPSIIPSLYVSLVCYPPLLSNIGAFIYDIYGGAQIYIFYVLPFLAVFGSLLVLEKLCKNNYFAYIIFLVGIFQFRNYVFSFYSETLLMFSILSFAYFANNGKEEYSGMSLGIGLLSRPDIIPIVALYVLWKFKRIIRLDKSMLLSIILIGISSLWMVRNFVLFGNPAAPLLLGKVGYPEYKIMYISMGKILSTISHPNFMPFTALREALSNFLLVYFIITIYEYIINGKDIDFNTIGIIAVVGASFATLPWYSGRYVLSAVIIAIYVISSKLKDYKRPEIKRLSIVLLVIFAIFFSVKTVSEINPVLYQKTLYICQNNILPKDAKIFVNSDFGLALEGRNIVTPLDYFKAERFCQLESREDYRQYFEDEKITYLVEYQNIIPYWHTNIFLNMDEKEWKIIYSDGVISIWKKIE